MNTVCGLYVMYGNNAFGVYISAVGKTPISGQSLSLLFIA